MWIEGISVPIKQPNVAEGGKVSGGDPQIILPENWGKWTHSMEEAIANGHLEIRLSSSQNPDVIEIAFCDPGGSSEVAADMLEAGDTFGFKVDLKTLRILNHAIEIAIVALEYRNQ